LLVVNRDELFGIETDMVSLPLENLSHGIFAGIFGSGDNPHLPPIPGLVC
jgi:hypothetical protein